MKLIWITANHPPDIGGMARSSERISNSLSGSGYDVTVLHFTNEESAAGPGDTGRIIRITPGMMNEPERIFWQYRDVMQGALFAGFGGTLAGYYAVLWARWLYTKSIVLMRGNDFDRTISDMRRAWITHFILDNADLVGAVSLEMTARIRSLRAGAVIYTPNSIDLQEWALLKSDIESAASVRRDIFNNAPGRTHVISMFGELKFKKGLDTALAVFDSFGLKDKAVLMTVGNLSEQMKEKLSSVLKNSWHHKPFLSRESLPALYRASDIVFIPSWYDGMPNVLLEAMGLGCIVVASTAGALPDVIEHGINGFMFPAGDIARAAGVLSAALVLDDAGRAAVSSEARRTIEEKFSPARETEIIRGALEGLV